MSVRPDGSILLRDLTNQPIFRTFQADAEEIRAACEREMRFEDDKQHRKGIDKGRRFSITYDDNAQGWTIKANQGHSHNIRRQMDADGVGELITLAAIADGRFPPEIVHGTYRRHFSSIRALGLRPSGDRYNPRHPGRDVHAARDASGTRADAELLIYGGSRS